jgi:hypothetical protein
VISILSGCSLLSCNNAINNNNNKVELNKTIYGSIIMNHGILLMPHQVDSSLINDFKPIVIDSEEVQIAEGLLSTCFKDAQKDLKCLADPNTNQSITEELDDKYSRLLMNKSTDCSPDLWSTQLHLSRQATSANQESTKELVSKSGKE